MHGRDATCDTAAMNFLAHALLAGGETEFLADADGFADDFRTWLDDARAFATGWMSAITSHTRHCDDAELFPGAKRPE